MCAIYIPYIIINKFLDVLHKMDYLGINCVDH